MCRALVYFSRTRGAVVFARVHHFICIFHDLQIYRRNCFDQLYMPIHLCPDVPFNRWSANKIRPRNFTWHSPCSCSLETVADIVDDDAVNTAPPLPINDYNGQLESSGKTSKFWKLWKLLHLHPKGNRKFIFKMLIFFI